jgi:hypothetical protein
MTEKQAINVHGYIFALFHMCICIDVVVQYEE